MRARIEIPRTPEYPREAIVQGLKAVGIEESPGLEEDLLVTWSPWARSHRAYLKQEFDGLHKPVIVAENGWLSPIQGRAYYQLALNGWNGTGRYPAGNDTRWASWGLRLAPWRYRVSGAALVIGQRGHPWDLMTAPPGWFESTNPADGRRIIRRPREATRPLAADLEEADVMHTWSSNAASWAILAGVPVVQHGPNLMVHELASKPDALSLYRGPREPELERLAWAQWDVEEIASGEPFKGLLELAYLDNWAGRRSA